MITRARNIKRKELKMWDEEIFIVCLAGTGIGLLVAFVAYQMAMLIGM